MSGTAMKYPVTRTCVSEIITKEEHDGSVFELTTTMGLATHLRVVHAKQNEVEISITGSTRVAHADARRIRVGKLFFTTPAAIDGEEHWSIDITEMHRYAADVPDLGIVELATPQQLVQQ